MAPKDVLDLPIQDDIFNMKTVREYLCVLLQMMWDKGVIFNLNDYDQDRQRWWEPVARVLIEQGEIIGQITQGRVFIVKRAELDEYMLAVIAAMCHGE